MATDEHFLNSHVRGALDTEWRRPAPLSLHSSGLAGLCWAAGQAWRTPCPDLPWTVPWKQPGLDTQRPREAGARHTTGGAHQPQGLRLVTSTPLRAHRLPCTELALGQVETGPLRTQPPCSALPPSKKTPKGPPHTSRGTQKQQALQIRAYPGSRFSVNQSEGITWGLPPFFLPFNLHSSLCAGSPRAFPLRRSKAARGDCVHKGVWSLRSAHISTAF